MKIRHLRARLPDEEYMALRISADAVGLTLSEHVRNLILRDRQALNQEQFLAKIDARLTAMSRAPEAVSTGTEQLEPVLVEVLFLVRELVAERNVQVLGRVSSQLNTIYPQRKKL